MKLKINYLFIVFIALLFMVYHSLLGDDCSLGLFAIYSSLTLLVIIKVFLKSFREHSLIGFFSIANIFIILIFIVRPLQLLFYENINLSGVINRYALYYGFLSVSTLPWAKAALIGLLGTVFLNLPFLALTTTHQQILSISFINQGNFNFSRKQLAGLTLFTFISFFFAGVYSSKVMKVFETSSLRIYDLVWVFLFSSIIIYIVSRKGKGGLFIYSILAFSIFLLSFRGRRQYVVNMLLCYMCSLYFTGKNRKKLLLKIGLVVVLILLIVFVYGNVRRELRGGGIQESFIIGILNEFCMFDMLLVVLNYIETFGLKLFWGYNYLSVFTIPIPEITIQPFDHMLTDIIFLGRFHGGIPTSLFGSLFLNFSFIGVCLGSLLLGVCLSFIQIRLANINNYNSIGNYSIFTTFVYDIIRVGDIGREIWSLITFLLVYYVFSHVMNRIARDINIANSRELD